MLTLLTGCPDDSSSDQSAGKNDRQAEIERLRGLPYAGGVAGSENDTRTGVVTFDRHASCPGYNLYTIQHAARADLIDEEGNVLRSWMGQPGGEWFDAELLDNGDLLAVGTDPHKGPRNGPGAADNERYLMRFDYDGNVLWKRHNNAHHAVTTTPDGHLLTLTLERTIVPSVSKEVPIRDDHLTLLDNEGHTAESFSLFRVLSRKPEMVHLHIGGSQWFGGGEWIDPLHANSVQWIDRPDLAGKSPIYAPGNVLTCYRHQNMIAVIDFARRELIWVWGKKRLSGPHDAQVLNSGNILIFDNGIDPTRQWSRVLEMDPRRGGIVWQYIAPNPRDFFTLGKGSAQRLTNGNTLIASSDQGWAFEVTPSKRIVWEFYCPYRTPDGERATIVRMRRYDRAWVDGISRRHDHAPPQKP